MHWNERNWQTKYKPRFFTRLKYFSLQVERYNAHEGAVLSEAKAAALSDLITKMTS